ncbi:MAG: flagellar basal body rod protein FlgB [Deltaproteobacteria bacterium]|nr:flagellar basal body rod protein FlgB [Deltaproteobacteria bacterium]
MDPLFDKAIGLLSTMLDYRAKRHKVIASNIANIDTPHYTAKDLVFDRELDAAVKGNETLSMARNDKRHLCRDAIPAKGADLHVVDSGKRVNIDQEMGKLAENHLMYNMTAELLARKFRGLNTVLKEVK